MTKKSMKGKLPIFMHCKNRDANLAEVAWGSLPRLKMRAAEARGWKTAVTPELQTIGVMAEVEV